MDRKAVTHLITLAAVLSLSAEELFIIPRNTESRVGDTTYFNCSTNLQSKEIFWNHGRKYIYTGDTIIDPYRGRFEIDRNASNGSHNLVIYSVKPSDAGEYICIDDDGHGTKRSAELVVLDNDPDCQSNIQPDGVIGQNIFNIPHDEVELTCNVTYHGSIPPEMEWKKIGDDGLPKDSITSNTTSSNRIIKILKLKGDITLDNSTYVCQTTRSAMTQYKCISETVKVSYFIGANTTEQTVVRGDKITCIANNTFFCIMQWYIGKTSCPLSCDEIITTHSLGEYLCTLKCNIRGKDFYFDALKAFVVEATTTPPPSKSGTIAASVVVPIVIIILVVLVAVCISRNNKRKKKLKILRQISRMKTEEQKIEWLLTMNSVHNRDEGLSTNDDIFAKDEIELLYKIKKEDNVMFDVKAILGVAILCEELFLVYEESSLLVVYDCNNFNRDKKLLSVKEVVAAVDICSCKENMCLYIMDKKNDHPSKEVLKIGRDGQLLLHWPTRDNAGGYLSATAEGNVIITVQCKPMLLEYSSEGQWVRDIKLPGCNNPWHAIKLDTDRYIVSHGTLFDPVHRVCRVVTEGKVDKSFGGKRGSMRIQLNIPFYLATGSNSDVMVADLCNNRLLLLDSNLEFKTSIVPEWEQGFRSPRRMCLHEGLLVVVIGEGIPKKRIYLEKADLKEETKSGDILLEGDSVTEIIHGEQQSSSTEIKESVKLTAFDEPKEIIHVETNDSLDETEKDDILKGNDDPTETLFGEANDSKTVKAMDANQETIHEDESDSDEESMLVDSFKRYIKSIRDRKRRMREVDVRKRIEEDCRLLVFNIQPLLQKYNG